MCEEPYSGKDCSYLPCKNNCSNTPELTVGECFQDYPMSYCRCDQRMKRGGDDCSLSYCLNECTGHGVCLEDSTCECEENYIGMDCSILMSAIIQGGINKLE